MVVTVVGKRDVSFTNESGQAVSFTELHCVSPSSEKFFAGNRVFTVKVSPDKVSNVVVGKAYDFMYEPDYKGMAKLKACIDVQ